MSAVSDVHVQLTEMVERLGAHPVSQRLALSECWDGGGVWGSAMEEVFTLCDWMTFGLGAQHLIPEAIGYGPSICGPEDESYMWHLVEEAWAASGLAAADVADYLTHLDILLDECERLGLDY